MNAKGKQNLTIGGALMTSCMLACGSSQPAPGSEPTPAPMSAPSEVGDSKNCVKPQDTIQVTSQFTTVDGVVIIDNALLVNGVPLSTCDALEDGTTCALSSASSAINVTFNRDSSNSFLYAYHPIGTNAVASIDAPLSVTPTNPIAFAVVGWNGSMLVVEGDPRITLTVASCPP